MPTPNKPNNSQESPRAHIKWKKKYHQKAPKDHCPSVKKKKKADESPLISECNCAGCKQFMEKFAQEKQGITRRTFIRGAIIAVVGAVAATKFLESDQNIPETVSEELLSMQKNKSTIKETGEIGTQKELTPEEAQEVLNIFQKYLQADTTTPITEETFIPMANELQMSPAFQKVAQKYQKEGETLSINPRSVAKMLAAVLIGSENPHLFDADLERKEMTLWQVAPPEKVEVELERGKMEPLKHDVWVVDIKNNSNKKRGGGIIVGMNALFSKVGSEKLPVLQKDRDLQEKLERAGAKDAYSPESITNSEVRKVTIIHESIHLWFAKQYGWQEKNGLDPYPAQKMTLVDGTETDFERPLLTIFVNEAIACSITNSSQTLSDDIIINSTFGNLSAGVESYGLYKDLFWQTAHAMGVTQDRSCPRSMNDFSHRMANVIQNGGVDTLRAINHAVVKTLAATLPEKKTTDLYDFE